MTVDEPRDDGRAGKLDREVRLRRVAGPHALDVAPVDEDPLPHRRVGEGDDPRCAVKGPHGAAMIEESRSPSATARASVTIREEPRLRGMEREPHAGGDVVERAERGADVGARTPQDDVVDPSDMSSAGAPDGADPTPRGRRWPGRPKDPGRSGGRARRARGRAGGRRRRARPPAPGAWRSSRARSTRSSRGRRRRRTTCPRVASSMILRSVLRHAARAGPHGARRHPPDAGRVRIANTSGPSARSIRPASGRTASRYSASPAGSSRVSHRSPPPGLGIDSKRGPAASFLDRRSGRAAAPSERDLLRGIRPGDRGGGGADRTVPGRSRAIGRRGDISLPHPRVGACSRAGRPRSRDPHRAAGRRAGHVRRRGCHGGSVGLRGPRAGPEARAARGDPRLSGGAWTRRRSACS